MEKALLDLFRELNGRGVRYLLFGGYAAILHGVPRATFGVDLLIDPAAENVDRATVALEGLR
jgi:hypothetical protein